MQSSDSVAFQPGMNILRTKDTRISETNQI